MLESNRGRGVLPSPNGRATDSVLPRNDQARPFQRSACARSAWPCAREARLGRARFGAAAAGHRAAFCADSARFQRRAQRLRARPPRAGRRCHRTRTGPPNTRLRCPGLCARSVPNRLLGPALAAAVTGCVYRPRGPAQRLCQCLQCSRCARPHSPAADRTEDFTTARRLSVTVIVPDAAELRRS
jgi:hypothetical protein